MCFWFQRDKSLSWQRSIAASSRHGGQSRKEAERSFLQMKAQSRVIELGLARD